MPPNIIQALDDPHLFGGMFDASSWRPWRAFLAALFALPMNDGALALYRHHTGRAAPPTKPSRYAELVVGRRGGKSRILALIASYLACVLDHAPHLSPGEVPVVAVIAKDRDQAKVILSYIVGFLRSVPLFSELIEDELAETVRLTNRVVIEVHTASIAAPRGRTFLGVLCDETAFWPAGDSANPDVEVINAVRPGLSTIPYSLLLIASSPYAKRGVLYSNYARYFGKDEAPVLVWQGTTREMNSNLEDDALIAEMEAEDPDRAAAEFGAQFRSDIVAFITREAIEDVVARGIRELPPGGGITYQGFADPSGGSADSFTLAIAHVDPNGIAVLDVVREVRPPFSPDGVVQEYAALLKLYGISRVTGDAYAGEWPRERFSVHGIQYDVSKKPKSAIYGEFLPALNGQRIRLLDIARLIGQLASLERRTARGGRDSIDHQPGAHDDVANAVAGVLVQIIEDRRPALVKPADLLTDGAAVPMPAICDKVFAVLTTDKAGTCATLYMATSPHFGIRLVLLDFDVAPMSAALFGGIRAQLAAFETQCRARRKSAGLFTNEILAHHAVVAGLQAQEIPIEYFDDPARLALSAAAHVAAGHVKLAVPAHERAQSSPLGGALALRGGEATADDPLRAAVLSGIALALDIPS